ncbi:MAG: VTT domain-containing protein, partial [Halofilum sp. (in: g-proteobacteria)]
FEGFFYALSATTLSGLASFAIGRGLGRRQVDRLAGSRVHDISLKLSRAGVTTVAAVRMLPITHFTVVSLVAGASHIRIRDFVAGTVLGMAPGTGAIAVFFNQVGIAASQPSLAQLLWLAAMSLGLLAGLLYLRRLTQAR